MLLALLLTMTSPAWCACAFAQMGAAGSDRAQDDGADACCPMATDECRPRVEPPCDQPLSSDSLPCRDRSDCHCCDSLTIIQSTGSISLSHDASVRAVVDVAPIPPAIVAIASMSDSADSWRLTARGRGGAPPWLPASASPLAQRCLLLI